MAITDQKIARAIEMLEAQGHTWTMALADAVRAEAVGADGKASARKIAAAARITGLTL
jgi:hypothetical protein